MRAKDKHTRTNRKPRSSPNPNSNSDSCHNKTVATPNSNRNPNIPPYSWGFCTEDELQELLLRNMEIVYADVVSKIVSMGYSEDQALKAVLNNGHCFGGVDALENILNNSLAYLKSNGNLEGSDDTMPVFTDLMQLEAYSLAAMVCLLQQLRPNLTKGDALWCLLVTDFHVGKASTIQVPVANNECTCCSSRTATTTATTTTTNTGDNAVGVVSPSPHFCESRGGPPDFNLVFACGHEMSLRLQRDIEFPKRFNLSPSMKSLLKRNVALCAAGFKAHSKQLPQPQAVAIPAGSTGPAEDAVTSMMNKFRELNLDDCMKLLAEDQKDEVLLALFNQVKDLEKELKVRKDWAHERAVQAATKLSNDMAELKMLRMESQREEAQKLKKGKQALDDATMKKLLEMEEALRKTSGEVDQANSTVKKLETENAEIRAELEASKLSASESVKNCTQVEKREKKCLKRLLAWEKQIAKLQQEISDEKQKIVEIEKELARIRQCQKEAEVKVREELKAKEEALVLIEEERHSKEAAEVDSKRNLKALRLKIEIDFQRRKDDLLRLEQELSCLKVSSRSADKHRKSKASRTGNSDVAKPQRETITKLLKELDNLEDFEEEVNGARECIICKGDEVSIVFLPCAHQIMCGSCSQEYGRKGKATCPCCRVPIEQRIRVFGAGS
ncbi:hypothetical protein HN51_068305 [Arachis hypogaea]|uniref:MND1-interacting protein 1 n=1 Tax=Arachis duranensis TaxID=130453 RepID=A0A6P4DEY6_ARADU|nr:MND1-interacting protein 1 [Arachis duranensis]XP_025652002.1 MND1-interacting protein 1-like [Arachis hypogaea]XP_025698479.1 MND1-interacting protein 1-like [Arachis hypogaea]QHO40520.1 MND1-interacting protein [Arachis hypogaea]